MRSFQDRVAVITGAASGIGRSLAVDLARRGCAIAIVDINMEGAEETRAMVEEAGQRASVHECNVADWDAVAALAPAVEREHGRIDILVNNAGVSVIAPFEEHSPKDWEWIFGINFWGVVYGTRAFLPYLRRSDDAYIVNLSSMFGLIGLPSQSSYCATKFAVRGLSESLSVELSDTNVRVLCVHPGGVATNIVGASRYLGSMQQTQDKVMRFFERFAMHPDKAAAQIVRAMRQRRSRVLVTAEAHVTDALKRVFPTIPPKWLAWVHQRVR